MTCWFLRATTIIAAIQLFTPLSAFGFHLDPPLDPEPPFVICNNQKYALCAEATSFVYDQVAYSECAILKGDSISLQLKYSSSTGEANVCDVNQQGKTNGYMLSTFSPPSDVQKGGQAAVYTCPGSANAGSGVSAPVAYAQCDGGICFKSTRRKNFPGFAGRLRNNQIICSCPISTDETQGGSNSFGYQVTGPYDPTAPAGSRCDVNACASCSVPNPTANGTILHVGSPTGTAKFLTLMLSGPPLEPINECLCTCTQAPNPNGSPSCTVAEDTTP
jgi:hypothetical protein